MKVAGRIALWGAIVLVLGRGLVSLFAGTGAGGLDDPALVREERFPVTEAQALAARFAADYLTYDEIDSSDWTTRTSVYGTGALTNAWDGKGRQSVTSVISAGVEVQSPVHAVVTVAALTGGGWVYLAVPVAATKAGLAVSARPAFVPIPKAGRAPDASAAGETDTAMTEALRPTVEAFLVAYGTGQQAVIAALSVAGTRFPSLEGRFTFAGLEDLIVPKATSGKARSALVTVRWADAQSGATLTPDLSARPHRKRRPLPDQLIRGVAPGPETKRRPTQRKGAAVTGEGLRTLIQTLVGNILLAGMGAAALVFLFQRQFVRLAEFAVIGILVATFIYTPEMWTGMGKAVANAFGTGG